MAAKNPAGADASRQPMSSEELSTAVKKFLAEHIQSVAQIELLTLVSCAPERDWTARAVDEVLRSNEESIGRWLAEFTRAGLLSETGGGAGAYRYHASDSALEAAANETVSAYRTRPVLVIETIFKPDSTSAQSFADAFRIRPR